MESPHLDTIEDQGELSALIGLFRYGNQFYGRLAFAIGLIGLSSAIVMLSSKFMGSLAEALLNQTENKILETIAYILILESLNIAIFYSGRLYLGYVTNQVALSIRQALFLKLSKLPIVYFDTQPLGRIITRLTSDVEGIESFFNGTLPRILTAIITIISVMLAMLITDFRMGLIISVSSLPALLFTIIMRKPLRKWLRIYKKRAAAINSKLAEFLSGLSIIKIFGLESWSEKQFSSSSHQLLAAGFMMMNWNTLIRPIATLFCSLPIVVILFWGGHQVIDQTMTFGLLVAFIRFSERYFRPIMQLSFEIHLIQDALASSERVLKILNEDEESKSLGDSGTLEMPIQGKVEFRDVWMSYENSLPILKGISFEINQGTTVGLVGRSGSGKSTTINLIPQLYPIKSGEILLDDININRWNRDFVRKNIGIVSQDVAIFHGTLRENLVMGMDDPSTSSDSEIWQACERIGLDHKIRSLPQGLDTMLSEGGSNLSMGERQLVAFVRVLLSDPQILILDEATANIDEHCEKLIQKATFEMMQNRTCFIIAHRLSTIRNCDTIFVFEGGRIIESGSHSDLIQRSGHYATLVRRQIHHESL